MGKIVWLASYPKSGNTWLRAFLHNLLRDVDEPYDINRLSDFTLGDAQAAWFQVFDSRPIEQWSKEEVAAMRPRVHESMTKAFPDSVFVKTHNALVEDRGHPMITMALTAGAIYVIRNPLDVVISHSHHYGLTVDQSIFVLNRPDVEGETEGRYVYEGHGSWSQHVASWTSVPNPSLLVVRYEDMAEGPHEAFGRVTAFLGLRPSRKRLHKAIKLSSFKQLREMEERHGFRERTLKAGRFFRVGRPGQWRDALTAAQIDAVVDANREMMSRFGYLPNGKPAANKH